MHTQLDYWVLPHWVSDTNQPPEKGAAKNKRGLHCLRLETAGLPALPRRQHGERIWFSPTVRASFQAVAGEFF
jgi:hypothetical protein